jgi:hypothetical protein
MGVAPTPLNFLPIPRVFAPMPAGTITDMIPFLNIVPFGMCNSPANPMVAAATAAALGVLTPMPCIPVPAGPWLPMSPTVLIGGKPALNNMSKLMCAWAGVIQIIFPGQVKVQLK